MSDPGQAAGGVRAFTSSHWHDPDDILGQAVPQGSGKGRQHPRPSCPWGPDGKRLCVPDLINNSFSMLLGFGYRTVALAGLRTLENLSALGMVHCIQQVLNKRYFFVLMVGSVRGKTGLLAIERTCGNTQWWPS